jgi:DNA-binding transcriptional LysR family regulator
MREPDLTSLRLFVEVCESGSISKVAERANIVGSAIGKRFAQLEAQLGMKLLMRRQHGVTPTEAGRKVLEHARSMLDSADRMRADVRSMAAGASGQVRVLASVSAIAEFLADDVAGFLAQPEHRAIQVDMEERINSEVARGVLQGMASLGVCWDAAELGGLQLRLYRTDRLCVVVPRGHALCGRARVTFADILAFEQVGLPVNSSIHVRLHRMAGDAGGTLRHRIVVSNFEAALRVVASGLAISVVPSTFADAVADAYQLQAIELDEAWAARRFVICIRDVAALTPPARLLLDSLCSMAALAENKASGRPAQRSPRIRKAGPTR